MATVRRDRLNYDQLIAMGWSYLVVWECETKLGNIEKLATQLKAFLS